MAQMINRDAAIQGLSTLSRIAHSDAQKALLGRALYIIEHIETIDITMCGQCMLRAGGVCSLMAFTVSPHDFCSGGMPKENL